MAAFASLRAFLRPGRRTPAAPRLGTALRLRGRFVHLHAVGEGRPVLLLHGCGSLGEEILSFLPPVEGVRWIAPDRPGYGHSEPLSGQGPQEMAGWLGDLLDVMDLGRVQVVAHSLAAGPALWLAALRPGQVAALTLLAPFCRPTPHRWMPGLRLLTSPLVGPVLRQHFLPNLLPLVEPQLMARLTAPKAPPAWLTDFPVAHATHSSALLTVRAELEAFNAGMACLPPLRLPLTVVVGGRDRTARPDWHLPWLAERVGSTPETILIEEAGHLVQHVAPRRVRAAILEQAAAAGLVAPAPATVPAGPRHAGQSGDRTR